MFNNQPNSTVYAFARVEAYLEQFAKDHQLSPEKLTKEVVKLLADGYSTVTSIVEAPTPTPVRPISSAKKSSKKRSIYTTPRHLLTPKELAERRRIEREAKRRSYARQRAQQHATDRNPEHATKPMGGVA